MSAPIFVTGVYRSGTTLLVKLLNNIQNISITHDSINFFRYYIDYQTKEDPHEIVVDIVDRISQRFEIACDKDHLLSLVKNDHSLEKIFEIVMVEIFCNGDYSKRWGEKSVLQWKNITYFLSALEKGKAILVIRDPRDALLSYKHFTYEEGQRYLDSVFASFNAMKWHLTVGKFLPKEKYIMVRYEDLVQDTSNEVRRISMFLEEPFDESILDSSKFKDHQGNSWSTNSSYKKASQGISSDSIGKWREQIADYELILTELVCGELMDQFGYQREMKNFGILEIQNLIQKIRTTPLIQKRFNRWMETNEGTDTYPSDPTTPMNWPENK